MPKWFVFDLDETLAHVNPYHLLVCTFFLADFATAVGRVDIARATPEILREPLADAYRRFVEYCGARERSENPIGIIRSSMVKLFVKIGQLKDAGVAGGCMIYSNNGTRNMLAFIRDVIHAAAGRDDLICDIAHLGDPRRRMEGQTKKIETIQRILRNGPCGATVEPEDVFFFDDINHDGISPYIGDQYIRVFPYTYRVNADEMLNLYLKSLRHAGIFTNPELRAAFIRHVQGVCVGPITPEATNEQFVDKLRINIKQTNAGPAPKVDRDLERFISRLDSMLPRGPNNENVLGNNPLSAIQINEPNLGNNPLSAIQTAGRRRKTNKNRKSSRKSRKLWRRRRV